MSVTSALLGFAVVAGLLTLVPGLDTALVLRSTLTHGRRHGFATAIGVNAGVLVWGAAAAAGVSALLSASSVASTVVRLVGAAYLVYLGVRLIVAALRRPHAPVAAVDPADAPSATPPAWDGFRRGFLTNLLNPKIGAFYVAVLPQFLPAGVEPLLMGLLLAVVHDVLGLAWFTVLILAAGAMRRLLRRPVVQRGVDALTGSVLVGFGLRLGLTARA